MVFASIREHAEHCDFFASTSRNKKFALRACEQLQKFGEHEQASTCLNFASKSSNGKILRAVKNFNGPLLPKFSRVFGVCSAPLFMLLRGHSTKRNDSVAENLLRHKEGFLVKAVKECP